MVKVLRVIYDVYTLRINFLLFPLFDIAFDLTKNLAKGYHNI